MKFEMMEIIQMTLGDFPTDLDLSMVITVQEEIITRMMIEQNYVEMALSQLVKNERMIVQQLIQMDVILHARLR